MSAIESKPVQTREANVLIELLARAPISLEVLDINSDDVLEAVQAHAQDIALGRPSRCGWPTPRSCCASTY
jgi:hypothetical protein